VIEIAKEYAKTGKFPEHDKKFKQIENEDYLCEIKGHQLRMIGFFNGLKFIIVHCVIKKQDKHKREDLKKANKLMEMYYAQA